MDRLLRLFAELRRRHVFKVAVSYGVAAWLLVQVVSVVHQAFEAPAWMMQALLIAVAAGFPLSLLLAWVYQLTPTGVVRTPRAAGAPSTARSNPSMDAPPRALADAPSTASVLAWAAVGAMLLIGAAVAWYARAPLPADRHLAVLPFRVVSPHAQAPILSAGLLETLTSRLTQLGSTHQNLWVVPASEVNASMTAGTAHKRFGVSLVVSGSVQMDTAAVRLTLNLIDARTQRQLSSVQIDAADNGLLALQDAATVHIARMLKLSLTDADRRALTAGGTADPDAHALYVRARGFLRQSQTLSSLTSAIHLFEDALTLDSTFALAHAGLGEAHWRAYRETDDPTHVGPAQQHSERALALNDDLAPVWITLGLIRGGQGDPAAALEALDRAVDADPRSVEAHRRRGILLRRLGRLDEAEAALKAAVALQPAYWRSRNSLGLFYYARGRTAHAVDQYTRALEQAPDTPSLLNNLAVAYWEMGRLTEAVNLFERLRSLNPDDPHTEINLATAYFYDGRFDAAADLYAAGVKRRPLDYALRGYLADAYAWSSDRRAQAVPVWEGALQMARDHLRIRGRDPLVLAHIAEYHLRLQRPDSTRAVLAEITQSVDPSTADVGLAFAVGSTYEELGDRDRARPWLEAALRRNHGWIQVQHSPWLPSLRSDPTIRRLQPAGGS